MQITLPPVKESLSFVYYLAGAIALVLAGIRVLYGWFKDYDASTRFTKDMALYHLPYIYTTLTAISSKLGIPDLKPPPNINFSQHKDPQA